MPSQSCSGRTGNAGAQPRIVFIYAQNECLDLQAHSASRRDVALAGLAALLVLPAGSAQAGFLGGPDKNEIYTADTVSDACIDSILCVQ